jgi:hypothetical protein
VTAIGLLLGGLGLVLITAGITDQDPRTLIVDTIRGTDSRKMTAAELADRAATGPQNAPAGGRGVGTEVYSSTGPQNAPAGGR